MSSPALICAMGLEEKVLRRALKEKSAGIREIPVLKTGTGPLRARKSLNEYLSLSRLFPAAVVGLAGATTSDLKPGDVVIATELRSGEKRIKLPRHPLLRRELKKSGLSVFEGTVATFTRPVLGSALKKALFQKGVVAVEMESFEVGAVFNEKGLPPPLVVRVISDNTEVELFETAFIKALPRVLSALSTASAITASYIHAYRPNRSVLLASPRSFCAGVERAIEIVERALFLFGPPVYVRKQIVHNKHVVEELAAKGAIFVEELDEVPEGATTVFSAHGVSPQVREQALRKGLKVIDATCPLVTKVHQEARRFAGKGYRVVLIGHRNHEETEGTLGEVEDMILIESEDDVENLPFKEDETVAYLTQTTLALDEVEGVIRRLKERYPNLQGPPQQDICYATQNRQDAVKAVARRCDFVLVIGSANSSNSVRLVEVAERHGARAVRVDNEEEVELEWFEGVERLGLTAGASAPDALVHSMLQALKPLGFTEVSEVEVTRESVRFQVPGILRKEKVRL